MRRAAVIFGAISIAGALALGGVATAASDKPLTKKQFIKKADRICTTGNAATNQLAQATFGKLGPNERPTTATLAKFWAGAREVLKDQVDQIGALHEPTADAKQVKRILAAVRKAIASIDANLQVVATGAPFATADRLAQRYGLKVCGAEG